MLTTYPFELPTHLTTRIPSPGRDGNAYVDARIGGRWDGILVIDSDRRCIGVYVHRSIIQWPLQFQPNEIEDLRPASIWNLVLATLPAGFTPYGASVVTVWILCPILLIFGLTTNILLLPLVAMIVIICHIGLYRVRGFPFSRFPTSVAGLGFLVAAIVGFVVKWLS
jgi:hypothetical protein